MRWVGLVVAVGLVSSWPVGRASAESAAPTADGAVDFIEEARLLARVAACAGDAPLPEEIDRKVSKSHCRGVKRHVRRYRRKWLEVARPFFATLVPADVPQTIVYPFGGADLLTAMAVFPDAKDITTIGLEPAGDPRTVTLFRDRAVKQPLKYVAREIRQLLRSNFSVTEKMKTSMWRGRLPTHLILSMLALDVHDCRASSVRYFDLSEDGRVEYMTSGQVAAADDLDEGKDRNRAFANLEIVYRCGSDQQDRVYRHLLANLSDRHLERDERALRHLRAKGRITAMTKAASFLLWRRKFSVIRDYLLGNMEWMISDATGIPATHAKPAGFEMTTWGQFKAPVIAPGAERGVTSAMRKLWAGQKRRRLAFRFGYPDAGGRNHLVVTRRRGRAGE